MKKQSRGARLANVKVIADCAETLDGMHAYLGQFGLASSGTRYLSEARNLPLDVTAAVLFPDEFQPQEVIAVVDAVQRTRPQILIVLVTGTPQRFGAVLQARGGSSLPVVLAKPVFGWTLVDLLRAHVEPRVQE